MAGRTVERPCAGRLLCPHASRGGCIVSVWSTPRVAENHARQIRSKVDSCPHGDIPGQGDEEQDTPMSASDTSDREYDFALILTGVPELTTDVEDGLFQAGCDDATLSMQYGSLYLDFSRAAPSLKDAILSAIRDVQVRCDGDGGQRATGGQSQNNADFPITALLARDVDEYPLCGLWNGRFAMAEEAPDAAPDRLCPRRRWPRAVA